MKKHVLALIAPLAVSLSASAMTIDFNEFAADASYTGLGYSFTSKGFVFSTTGPQQFAVWGKTNTWSADPGRAAIWHQTNATMKQANGAAFSLYSIDMDDGITLPPGMPSNDPYHPIKFTFNYVGGGKSEKTVYLDPVGGLQTFVFGEYNLLSVTWEHVFGGTTSMGQLDNVKVNVDCGTR